MLQTIITILHVLVAIAVIVFVLIQHGKGADVGAAFGSGASNTMFGSQGATPFLVKLTGALAFVFFVTSLTLSLLVSKHEKPITSVNMPVPVTQTAPPAATLAPQPATTSSSAVPPEQTTK